MIHGKEEDGTVNYMAHETNKLVLFLTHFFVLSSRLIAIALFTVSFKWWITTVMCRCNFSFYRDSHLWCQFVLSQRRMKCNICKFVGFLFLLPLVARWPDNENRQWVISRKEKEGVEKNADVLQRVFCDRKHHHDLVVLFQSVPSYLVRSTRHGLRQFFCSSWSHNESDSFLFLKERIKYSRNSRELPTYTARVGGSPREGGYFRNFWVRCAAGSLEPLTFTRASSAEFCYPILE